MAVLTTDADAVCPLLEQVRTTRADVVVTNGCVVARESALREVKARPASRVKGMDILDELVGVGPAHLNVRATARRGGVSTRAVNLRAGS